jgi:hypothetical protein
MSDEKEELKKLMGEFVGAVNGLLKRHEEAISRLAENLKLEHVNVKEVAEQVNHHTAILSALDAEVKKRLGYSTDEPPQAVN